MSCIHSSLVAVPPLDNEDLLREILLRLPPRPSSFPRASLVCKRWRSILSDSQFPCRFRLHHRKTSLLGFFVKQDSQAPLFTPILDPPHRIPAELFTLPENLITRSSLGPFFLGCRDGVALFLDRIRREVILWDPITGIQRHVPFRSRFCNGKDKFIQSVALLCSAGDDHRHVQSSCNLNPFKLVLLWHDGRPIKASVCLYESRSDAWGDIISTETRDVICVNRPNILVRNSLYWLLSGGGILEFDFERHTLAVIEKPAYIHVIRPPASINWSFQILRGEDNGLGLAVFSNSELCIRLWVRKSNCDGVVSWVLQKTVQLDELSQPLHANKLHLLAGYDEATNVIFLSSFCHDFILQLESMQFRYLGKRVYTGSRTYYPYTKFYTTVRGAACVDCGAQHVNA